MKFENRAVQDLDRKMNKKTKKQPTQSLQFVMNKWQKCRSRHDFKLLQIVIPNTT